MKENLMKSHIGRGVFLGALLFFRFVAVAQEPVSAETVLEWKVVKEFPQKSFSKSVPPGNYSGITRLQDDIYAVVSDKSDSALYFNFRILVNPKTGKLEHVENLGFTEYVGDKQNGYDHEAIAKVSDSTLIVSSEGYHRLKEYPIVSKNIKKKDGLWENRWSSDSFYPNYVFESLAFDSIRHRLWTISESTLRKDGMPSTPENGLANKLRLLSYFWDGRKYWEKGTTAQEKDVNATDANSGAMKTAMYAYQMDAPTIRRKAATYVMGVSELCTLPDGQLLVLEREAFIPKIKVGAFCKCKLYVVDPLHGELFSEAESFSEDTPFLKKRLLTEWKTGLSFWDRSFANYEGMCLGPKLEDGSLVLILLADSQDQYAGVLKDWFKTIVIKKDETSAY